MKAATDKLCSLEDALTNEGGSVELVRHVGNQRQAFSYLPWTFVVG